MADNLTAPATGAVLASKDVGGVQFPWNLLADAAGADAMGIVGPSPAANSLLGRLKGIQDTLATIDGHVDGLEALSTALNGFVDGLEALIGTTNTTLGTTNSTLTALNGYVDGLETLATALNGYVDGLEALHGTTNSTLAAIQGYVDGLETLIGATNTALAAATPAGENYIGKTGGDVLQTTATPTVSTTAYSAEDCIGGLMTFANMLRVAGGSAILQGITINCKSNQTAAIDLILFGSSPSNTTFTDNAALALNAADFDKVIETIHITDWTKLGTSSFARLQNIGTAIKLAGGTTLYGVLVARGALTLASTSDLKVAASTIPG